MSKNNIKTSGFSLAKRKELTGDDFYEIKQLDDMTIAVMSIRKKTSDNKIKYVNVSYPY